MKLYAISDVHVGHGENLEVLDAIEPHPDDWLIVAGDVGETCAHLETALDLLGAKFERLIWVPGNHELWTTEEDGVALGGAAKYDALVALCRERGVITPQDPYPRWEGEGGPCIIAPLFVLYDYSFGPDGASKEEAVAWARSAGILCADEIKLAPTPYASRQAWCRARVEYSEQRLTEVSGDVPLVLVNHFPLRRDLVRIPAIPRFVIWCGTRATHTWHTDYGASVVVTGHLHRPATDWIDGVRFEEVSLGYPRQWNRRRRAGHAHLREILPGPTPPVDTERHGPIWHV